MQAAIGTAMNMGAATEDCLRENHFQFRTTPILNPLVEEIELPLTEQHSSFDVNASRIVIRVPDMVRSWALLGHSPGGTGLVLFIVRCQNRSGA